MSSEGIFTLQKSLFSHVLFRHSSFFCSKKRRQFKTIKILLFFYVVRLNYADNFFLLQDNGIAFLRLKSLKEWLVLHGLSYVLKHKQDIFFSFLAYKTLRAIVSLFFLMFFGIIFLLWKIYSFPFVFLYKRFKFWCSGSFISS